MSHGCKPRISNSIKVWQLGIGNRELSAMLCSRDHPPPPQCAISYSQGYYERPGAHQMEPPSPLIS